MNEGPSSSYSNRGGRGWGGNRNNNYRGGRGYSSYDRPDYGGYEQENYYQPGRGSNRGRNYAPQSNGWGNNRGGRGSGYQGRNSNMWGNNNRGGGRSYGRSGGRSGGRGTFDDPEDIKYLRVLRGHTDGVTAMVVNEATGQLFTGSKDQTVRMWEVNTGQALRTVEIGGVVDSLLLESGMLFVGAHMSGNKADLKNLPGSIKVFNLQAGSESLLQGHLGPVYALAAGHNMLFSGGHDQSIRVWQFNQASGIFEAAAMLTAAQGGHAVEVKALQVINKYLFSADFHGIIKVWDMDAGQCVQNIQPAHSNVVMSLLAWQGFLLSGSIDGLIRIWQFVENPAPGAVLEPVPSYSHPPTTAPTPPDPEGDGMFGQVLSLAGTTDRESNSILLASCSTRTVRLWQLPDFTDRGHLNAIHALTLASSGEYIFGGDYNSGNIKMWMWKTQAG